MREIDAKLISETISRMCIQANCILPDDVKCCIETARKNEPFPTAQVVLDKIIENYNIAEKDMVPICQDTGMACVFLEIGQDVHICGNLTDAVNEGVRDGYKKGFLRKSVVGDPIERKNTGDNTPALIYTELVDGDQIKITVAPKGFGSENMSKVKMLKPADGIDGVKDFILECIDAAGPNPCPPVVVGVGIGGSFDKSALMAKKALLRPLGEHHPEKFYADLETEMLEKINAKGIGPQGFGGKCYALGVNIEKMPTHIAGLPVAVNINCHVARHVTEVL